MEADGRTQDLERLDGLIRDALPEPRASVGRACLRFKRLDDLDEAALRALLEKAGRLAAPGAA